MILLYLIGFVGGLVAGISPCILPVLPVILVAGATRPEMTVAPASPSSGPAPPVAARPNRSARAYAVIAGLVLSFAVFTLTGSALLSALHLPQDLLRDAGLAVLAAVALGLLVPEVGHVLERPFAPLGRRQPSGNSGGFVLGLGLGVLFTPCAGPILGAIDTLGASHRFGFPSFVLSFVFACGAAVPLLAFALAGQRIVERVTAFKTHAPLVRRIGGAVLAVMTVVLAFNWTGGLQTAVPGYTNALQKDIEGGSYVKNQTNALEGRATTTNLSNCPPETTLVRCGPAPAFTGITRWLNTAGDRPLTLRSLRGKVVLVDFWTYSCIDCQRSLPHVEAWYGRYHDYGFEVVGVHTPEFPFEHVVSNVLAASRQLDVHYPIAIDDDYKTWNAYDNMSWPAEYLIDATGQVRHVAFGEGDYGATESLIRALLHQANPHEHLPPRTGVPDRTPSAQLTEESYLGYDYQFRNLANASITPDRPADYMFPTTLPLDDLALAGTWTSGPEDLTAGTGARIELAFMADDVYLVTGGTGTLNVTVNGRHTETVAVSGVPRLYTLVHGSYQVSTLTVSASPGVMAYDFTFG